MTDPDIRGVRRFNREVAERIGAVTDQFLGRARPMGEARIIWEIGPDGTDVRALRTRLGLDSGYTSRVLRSLERQALVTVGPSPGDRRVRRVELTGTGLADGSNSIDDRTRSRLGSSSLSAPANVHG